MHNGLWIELKKNMFGIKVIFFTKTNYFLQKAQKLKNANRLSSPSALKQVTYHGILTHGRLD